MHLRPSCIQPTKYLNIVRLYFVCRRHNYPFLKQWCCYPNNADQPRIFRSNWFKTNKLSVNTTKTNCMIMGTETISRNVGMINKLILFIYLFILSFIYLLFFLSLLFFFLSFVFYLFFCFAPEGIVVLPYVNYGILILGQARKTYLGL